jgi:hypothetical protein
MKKYALALCLALPLLAGCNNSAVTSTNNVLANLAGGTSAVAFQAGCSIVAVAEGYYPTSNPNPTPAEALAVSSAEAVVAALCKNPPTNLTIAFNDLLSAWNVIQAGTTVPTTANPAPSVPPLVVNSIPTPVPTSN